MRRPSPLRRPLPRPLAAPRPGRGPTPAPRRGGAWAGLLGACLALGAGGCVQVRETAPYYGDGEVLTATRASGAWWVEQDGRRVGSVVRFEGQDGSLNYVVRNVHGQDLGGVDALGRAWRQRPHREPELVVSGTVLDGVRAILDLEAPARLVETPLEQLADASEAATGR